MGVSRQTISSLENGRYNPSIMLAYKIAKHFGMAIEEVAYYVGVLANQGLKGEMAGTSLRNILARMGGSDVQKQFENLGYVKLS